jgi:hypothetical protein
MMDSTVRYGRLSIRNLGVSEKLGGTLEASGRIIDWRLLGVDDELSCRR